MLCAKMHPSGGADPLQVADLLQVDGYFFFVAQRSLFEPRHSCLSSPNSPKGATPPPIERDVRRGRAGRRPPTGDGPIRQCRAWPARSWMTSDNIRPVGEGAPDPICREE